MATRVGKIHVHDLPKAEGVERFEVYRCHCNKEFVRINSDRDNIPSWASLDSSQHLVEYDVEDSPLIGRYVPQPVERPKNSEAGEGLIENVPGLEGHTEFAHDNA